MFLLVPLQIVIGFTIKNPQKQEVHSDLPEKVFTMSIPNEPREVAIPRLIGQASIIGACFYSAPSQ